MSTKTTFKRIALVAVASLGFGLVSVIPSEANIGSSFTLTPADGTASTATSDSSGAGYVTVKFLSDSLGDSMFVQPSLKSAPAGAASIVPILMVWETTTTGGVVSSGTNDGANASLFPAVVDSNTNEITGARSNRFETSTGSVVIKNDTSTVGYAQAKFKVFLDTSITGTAVALTAGTYVISVLATPYDRGAINTANRQTVDINIVVDAVATASKVADPSTSKAVLYQGSAFGASYGGSNDSASVAGAATASSTAIAVVRVYLRNTAGTASAGYAQESITATISLGNIGTSSVKGRSVVLPYDATDYAAGYKDLLITGDGNAGTATVTVKSTSVTFGNKTVNFYSTSVATIVATTINTVIATGAQSSVVAGLAKDSNGIVSNSATSVYAYSSDTSIVSDYGTACTFNATIGQHLCDLTGVVAGTTTITLRNKSTLALSTVASTPVTVKVSGNTADKFTIKWDKDSYVPGEKATLTVTVVDSSGNSIPAATFSNLFATGGISIDRIASTDTLTATSVTTAASVALGLYTPVKTYTVYMPTAGGPVTASVTGGVSLPTLNQTKVTAVANVVDNGASALAAVTALASQVSAFITKINAQITTLTDLVMKIQKKVKA